MAYISGDSRINSGSASVDWEAWPFPTSHTAGISPFRYLQVSYFIQWQRVRMCGTRAVLMFFRNCHNAQIHLYIYSHENFCEILVAFKHTILCQKILSKLWFMLFILLLSGRAWYKRLFVLKRYVFCDLKNLLLYISLKSVKLFLLEFLHF